MLNFTVGPVEISEEILELGAKPVPYFRTPEFSETMLENETLLKRIAKADENSRAVFLTASGTGAMEAAVINCFTRQDKVLIVNGGGFGQRFVNICSVYDIPYEEIKLDSGKTLTEDVLNQYDGRRYTGFIVNAHETSTGVYYDMPMISRFCKENDLFLMVDAISSFIADPFEMKEWGIDCTIISSQKALALPPGISAVILSDRGVERVLLAKPKTFYFDLKDALKNGERGQTPFTPAVGILLQLNRRLQLIHERGVENETAAIRQIASHFREHIKSLPFEIYSERLSNAVTPLTPKGQVSAYRIFEILKNEYEIFVCPNGGALADKVIIIGHIGHLTIEDNCVLINALKDMKRRQLI